MKQGEEALIFRLVFPAGSPGIPTRQKGKFTLEFIQRYCEIGLLRHLGGEVGKNETIEVWQEVREYLNVEKVKTEYDISKSSLYPSRLKEGWLSDDAKRKLSKFFNKLFRSLKDFA